MTCCPDCGGETRFVGDGLDFGAFAGGALIEGQTRTRLWQCNACHLVFKELAAAAVPTTANYNQTDGAVWGSGRRPEFDLAAAQVAQELAERGSCRVLDVGCNRGEFLARLPTDASRCGLEVNRAAAARARAVADEVWTDMKAVPANDRFDVVTAFDVIEHVREPGGFLDSLLARVATGGTLVLSTGNAEAFLAQPRPALNWYFGNPEHLSFISEAWMRHRLQMQGGSGPEAVLERSARFLHGRENVGIVPSLKVAAFKLAPRAYLCAYKALKRRAGPPSPLYLPGNGSFVDHLCMVVRRSSPAAH